MSGHGFSQSVAVVREGCERFVQGCPPGCHPCLRLLLSPQQPAQWTHSECACSEHPALQPNSRPCAVAEVVGPTPGTAACEYADIPVADLFAARRRSAKYPPAPVGDLVIVPRSGDCVGDAPIAANSEVIAVWPARPLLLLPSFLKPAMSVRQQRRLARH